MLQAREGLRMKQQEFQIFVARRYIL
jgi:hypothetical protein